MRSKMCRVSGCKGLRVQFQDMRFKDLEILRELTDVRSYGVPFKSSL